MREKLIESLAESADPDAVSWLRDTISNLSVTFEKRPFYYSFSGVSRRFDKSAKIEGADDSPFDGWDEYRAARVALLLVLDEQEKTIFLETFFSVLNTADIREQIALFSSLQWMPYQDELIEAAVDGLRTNIVDIFDAIALDNPFPQMHFTEEAWNQMMLKAIFMTRPLHRIHGVAERKNRPLAEAISDLAHERWAAGRVITPEAWRSVIGFLDERHSDDIRKVAGSENPSDRAAASLVVSESGDSLIDLQESLTEELALIDSGELSWHSLGQTIEEQLVRESLT
jgi:hypothetical protein